ncbi:hypothetical protein BAE44_0001708 [Dichanthelium oligosanthes]|uniref:Agenet domain-containing protein n=1 Tax=Dichanthelium oligosanthes TaxID=888268 RepID=A0A1E5WIR9_9POAL|nr:hypothetical protein BAE44_0001708 [Dichanthelium oligosanthes]
MVRGRPRRRSRARAELGDEAAGEDPPALFPLGAPVEVRSDDSGFAGSFYEATVVGYQRNGLGYVVAYSTLTRSRDGGSPLRELAAAVDVRPRPPPAPPREFAVHEMVEAFHNDGWWAGVVCAVPPVPVPVPVAPETETAERPRRVYKENRTPLFREGSQVEVSRSAKTFGKYWCPAIILKVIGATSFLVQYRDVKEDGEQVTEILDSQYIRPTRNIICMDSKYRFPPSSHAEVFHEGSWWPGVISEVLDNESTKKYVVKIKGQEADMDDVECVDLLTVDHTQLRPQYNWYHGKWVRCLTQIFDQEYLNDGVMSFPFQKSANKGPQLTPRKRPISAALASCSDSVQLTASAPCNDSEEIRDEPGSYLKEKVNDEDLVLKQNCPDLLCNENVETKHMQISYPEKVVKQQNTVLSWDHLTLPSQSSVTGFRNLKYDPKLCLSGQLELSTSQMITMPSVPQTGQLQASLFGAFGQLRPLPQGPIFGMQSHTLDFGSIVGSERAFTDQGKQANDKGCYLMTGSRQNINFGSFSGTHLSKKRLFNDQGKKINDKGCYLMTGSKQNINFGSFSGTDLSRKRLNESVSQTPELLGRSPKIMPKRKRMADKKVKEASNFAAVSEEPTEPNNDDGKDLPKNVDPGSVVLSEVNTVTSTGSRPLKDDKGSQGISVFLRESSVADEIIPSGVPIGADTFQREDYIGAAQHVGTEVSVLIERSVLSITSTLDNPGEAHVPPSDSTQCGNKEVNADKSAIIMEQATGEVDQRPSVMDDGANVHFLPSAESCEDTGDKDNMEAVVECVRSCVVPTEKVSCMGGVASNMLPSSNNCGDNKDGMAKADHQENTCNMPETEHACGDGLSLAISLPAFKKFAAHEQHGVSQQDHSSSMVECAAEGSQYIENSEITQLSSIGMSNSTEAEQGDTLIASKNSEGTPMSKYVPSRTQGSCISFLQRSLDVHESIMADRTSESLAIENLPFTTTSPMWAQIEAMEVFRKVPQRPNFDQFQLHVPELREGMALGLMLSFANLAESIRKLSIHDEDALFEEKMKGLSLLEADGFDVRHLRSRMETLLHIRNGRPGLEGAIKDLEEKIFQKETDDRLLGTQIGVLNMTVRQLELQAYLFRRITQSAISQKMNDASEIARLKTEAGVLKQSYLSAEQCFSSAAAAPW